MKNKILTFIALALLTACSDDDSVIIREVLTPEMIKVSIPEIDENYESALADYHGQFGTFIDERDGQVYRTVELGNLVWMIDNFNYSMEGKAHAPEDEAIRGKLYTWRSAKKFTPDGWRLPSKKEWMDMAYHLNHSMYQIYWSKKKNKEYKANDDFLEFFDFAGYKHADGQFDGQGRAGYYWTKTPKDFDTRLAFYRYKNHHQMRRSDFYMDNAFSVLYVKDRK